MMIKSRPLTTSVSLFALAAVLTSPTWAAEPVDTVVVTASKRKEDVRTVPLAVSVLGGEALEDQHIVDLADLSRAIPNLSFSGGQSGGGSGLANIQLRGISSQAGSATVGVYMDDVSMTTRNLYSVGSAEPKFFDIDRIEVLRGPQGTLYGASSMGGTIKFVTNQPNANQRETNFNAELSSTEHGGINSLVSAVFNAPLVAGELGLRLGVQAGHTSGYIDQVSQTDGHVIAKGINASDDLVMRLAAKWTPNARWTVSPSLFYQRVKSDGMDVSRQNWGVNQTDQLLREPGKDSILVPSLTLGYDLGKADVTSVTSLYRRQFDRTQDGQAANSAYIGPWLIGEPAGLKAPAGLGDAVAALPSAVILNNDVRQISQELRIASKGYDGTGSPMVWLAGVYYAHLKTRVTDNEPVYGINATFAKYHVSPADDSILSGAYPNDFPGDNAYFSERRYDETQTALFGEVSYYVSPVLRLTAGARQIRAKETLDRDGDFFFAGGPQHSSFTGDYKKLTPKFAVSWDMDKNNTLFASATQGFRLGGANRPIPMSICGNDLKSLGINTQPQTFDSDSLWSYEVGNKSRWLEGKLTFNGSLFYVKWKNIQQDVVLPCTFDFEGNFGEATSYGAEVEARYKATSNFTVSVFGGYTHAALDQDVSALGAKSGDPLIGVPTWNSAISGEYRIPTTRGYNGFVRGAVRWVGSSHGSIDPTNVDYSRPAYHIVDASIGATFGTWDVSLFAKNLLNDKTIIQQPYVQYQTEALRPRPRTLGVNFSARM